MKNVKIILLLSVIISLIYFTKINEGFSPNELFTNLKDLIGGGETNDETDNIECHPTHSSSENAKNTAFVELCSHDDSIRNLNNILQTPKYNIVLPKDPIDIKYLQFLSNNVNTTNSKINDKKLTDINLYESFWKYDFETQENTPEITLKNQDNNDITSGVGVDLVYLSGCSEIIEDEDATKNNCHSHTDMHSCNESPKCVWDALCEQPHRPSADFDKVYTPKECVLHGGIFRTDLLRFANNDIISNNISTTFNKSKLNSFITQLTTDRTNNKNDSDSCSFIPNSNNDYSVLSSIVGPKNTDSYFNSSCYPELISKNSPYDLVNIDNDQFVETNVLYKTNNAYNTPQDLLEFKYQDSNCKWSQRADDPESWANCFNTNVDYNKLTQTDWSNYTCQRWSEENPTKNCLQNNNGKTRLNPDIIISETTDTIEKIKEACCLNEKTCSNINGVDSIHEHVTQFSCPQDFRLSSNHDTCSEEGCNPDDCCSPAFTCDNIHGVDSDHEIFSCQGDTFIKDNPDNCSNDGCSQSNCCEEPPLCTTHYSSDEDCPGGYYFDTNASCTTQDCSVGDCCKIKAACYNFQCNDGYRLKNNGRTSCPTVESSCNHSVCCEPEPTCSDMSESIECGTGKTLNGNRIYDVDHTDACCIDDKLFCYKESDNSIIDVSPQSFDSQRIGIECGITAANMGVLTQASSIQIDTLNAESLGFLYHETGLTLPSSNCGAEAESFHCPADKPILDTYMPCTGDSCDADHCCKTETYFCKGQDFNDEQGNTKNVIYQNARDPPSSDTIPQEPPSCLSDILTNFIWESCSNALSSIDLSSYPYIGNIYQACRVESPSVLSGHGDAIIPPQVNNPSQPICSSDICTTGKVLRSNPRPICSSETCTVNECCEDENSCANYYHSNTCPAGNKTDGQCVGVCTPEDCCLPSNTINLSLQIGDDPSTGTASGQSSSFNTILQTYLNKMIIVPDPYPSKVYFTSYDTWNLDDTSKFFTLKYTPTDNISPASSITDPNTDPDSNSIKFYVKGSYESPDISHLIRLQDITGDGNRDILTFIVELNNLHFKSSASKHINYVGDIIFNCGDSNFQSTEINIYKFLLYKENNNLKLYTSSEQGQDISSFIESSTSPTGVHYDIGTIDGNKIIFDINRILNSIGSNLTNPGGSSKSFEEILLKLLALRTDDIHDMFFGNTSATIILDTDTWFGSGTTTITNENSPNGSSLENKICNLDLDIDKTDSWSVDSIAINGYLKTYDFADLTESTSPRHPSTPGIDNFVKYDNGLFFNTHFSVCNPQSFTLSDIPSLIIRLKELILTGIDIYTLYTSNTGDNFNKEPIGCSGSSTLVDGSVFTPEEIRTINSLLTRDEITTINSFISNYGIDISNLQYTSSPDTPSPDKIHYTSDGKNIDTIVLTIS